MKVFNEKVLVKAIDEKEKATLTKSGLTIPGGYENRGISKVEIIAVGEGTEYSPMRATPGKICLIYENTGTEITDPGSGEKYRVITQSEIIVEL